MLGGLAVLAGCSSGSAGAKSVQDGAQGIDTISSGAADGQATASKDGPDVPTDSPQVAAPDALTGADVMSLPQDGATVADGSPESDGAADAPWRAETGSPADLGGVADSKGEPAPDARPDAGSDSAPADSPADSGLVPVDAPTGDDEGISDASFAEAPPSCLGLAHNCGANADDDCCASLPVPGGSFSFGNGASAATVAAFLLDKYEVSVGRFRAFVAAYKGHPANGAGEHPLIPGTGWQSPKWDSYMEEDAATLENYVRCSSQYQTYYTGGSTDRLPINCVSWFEAFAFCVWDGGRLPTEAEWEYAASGGDEQRPLPWGSNGPALTNRQDSSAAYANYDGLGNGGPPEALQFADILPVGSKPAGAGRWGHLDLVGSVDEWVYDAYINNTYINPCSNCAAMDPSPTRYRIIRGGSWVDDASWLNTTRRFDYDPNANEYTTGFRCARSP